MLEITDFSVAFGKAKILNRITLRVGKGEVVTLIGPNGCR